MADLKDRIASLEEAVAESEWRQYVAAFASETAADLDDEIDRWLTEARLDLDIRIESIAHSCAMASESGESLSSTVYVTYSALILYASRDKEVPA